MLCRLSEIEEKRECGRVPFETVLSLIFALLLVVSTKSEAQDRLELGIAGGVSYYLGEMNPSQHFKEPRVSAGFLGRYVVSDRIAVKAILSYDGIKGEYNESNGDVYSYDHSAYVGTLEEGETEALRPANCSFRNELFDLSVMGEVNFLSYDHMFKKDVTRFTPYLSLGLGVTSYGAYKDDGDKKRQIVLSLPFGVGVKYKLNKLLRVGLDWTLHKTFTDELENVKDDSDTFDASDPYKNGVHKITHNNDWFSNLTVTLTISMWPRSLVCNDGLRTFNRE